MSSFDHRTVLRLEEQPERVTLYVQGPLTGRAFGDVCKLLNFRRVAGRPLWIDLHGLTSIDTGGMGVLLLADRLANSSSLVRVRGAGAQIREMLSLVSARALLLA